MTHAPLCYPSPNFGPRRGGARPSLIIIHYTAMESAEAAQARLCDPVAEVSAHWLISEKGAVTALVPEAERAWHAGLSYWQGVTDLNSHSIGIELANRGDHPFPEPQMHALERLLAEIMTRWSIPAEGVLGHSDIAPMRKIDPGERFDWARLARLGLAAKTPSASCANEASEGDFMTLATAAGYDPEAGFDAILRALRLRYRPWASGGLMGQDFEILQALARLSVDGGEASA